MPDDPEVYRLWQIATAAQVFKVSPVQIARDIENDREDLVLTSLRMLHYRDLLDVMERNDPKEMKQYDGDLAMEDVVRNAAIVAEQDPAFAQEDATEDEEEEEEEQT